MPALQAPKNPLILRYHRLMDVFTKSGDEKDFYLDTIEGFLVYGDLDKPTEELDALSEELMRHPGRYKLIPKLSFYEVKKIMEGFVHEKVYDIDTKEKLLDIISGREAREHFLDFIYDNLAELEKWQLYFQERSRIRIIEWLRSHEIRFVFEEDVDLPRMMVEKVKRMLFDTKVPKEVQQARAQLEAKAKTYYSNEALNPRPKRGRPPKQTAKIEIEPQFTLDIYTTVPSEVRPFLYIPDITSASSVTFSSEFETEEKRLAWLKGSNRIGVDKKLEELSERLDSLRHLSSRLSTMKDLDYKVPFPRKSEEKSFEASLEPTAKLEGIQQKITGSKKPAEKGEPEEFTPQRRRRFAVKKVAPIHIKKKKQ